MNIISMKSITLLFTLMLVVVWANAQEVSLDRQESTGRTYFRVVVQDEWDFANPQIAGGKQYGQSPVYYTASSAGLASLLNPAPPAPTTCDDPTATNFGLALPCTYPSGPCDDPTATNFGLALPCTYPSGGGGTGGGGTGGGGTGGGGTGGGGTGGVLGCYDPIASNYLDPFLACEYD